MNDKFQLIAPTGERIVGTAEMVPGTSYVSYWVRGADGKIEVGAFCGDTDMYWDCSETQEDPETKETLVVDDSGNQWKISECLVADEQEDNEP